MDLNKIDELKKEEIRVGKYDSIIPVISSKKSIIGMVKRLKEQEESISNLKKDFNIEIREMKEYISNLSKSTNSNERNGGDSFYNSIYASYFGKNDKFKATGHLKEAIRYSQSKGYLTVYNSPLEREQQDELRKYAQTISYIRAHEDPIIGAIPDSIMRFVLGRGIKYKCSDYRIQAVLDRFWNLNNMEMFNKQALWLLIVESEFFPLYFIDESNGDTYIREVQPSEIEDIETHKEDRRTILSYKRTFYQKDYNKAELTGNEVYYADIDYYERKENSKALSATSEYESHEHWQGKNKLMQFVKFMNNREVRSRVYLERVLKWAEWYKNWIIDRAIINHEKGRVVWILEISGRSDDVWERFKPAPQGGLTRISTPEKQWKPVNANIKADDAKEDGLFLLYQVAAGSGIPIHVLTQRTTEQVYACYSEDTTVLTSNGWKLYDDISDSDKIGTVNPNTLKFEWNTINEKFIYDYSGEMYHIKSRGTDALVTPNHELFIQDIYREKKWIKQRADSLSLKRFNVISGLEWDDSQVINKTTTIVPDFLDISKEDWLRFLGIYIGDGSLCRYKEFYKDSIYNRSTISFHIKKKRKVEYFSNILLKMEFNHRVYEDGYNTFDNSKNHELHDWLEDNVGRYCYDKKIPEFIMNLPKDELSIFFEALMQSDGSYDSRETVTSSCYITTSKELSEQVMLLGLRLGLRTYIKERKHPDKNRKLSYYVRMSEHKKELLIPAYRNNISKEKYDGKVWCLNVNNHTLITRRNGKIAVHGNSLRKADTPFSQLILDIQDTLKESYFKPMFKVVIRSAVKYGKLSKKVKIRKYVNEELKNIFRHNYDRYLEGKIDYDKMIRYTKDLIESYMNTLYTDKEVNDDLKFDILKECTDVFNSLSDSYSRIIEGKTKKKKDDDFIKKAYDMFENGFMVTVNAEDVPIEITFPDMVREDLAESARVLKIHREIGIVSKTTASARAGYNPEQEKYLIKTENFGIEEEKNNDEEDIPEGGDSDERDGDGDGNRDISKTKSKSKGDTDTKE